jgi:hypothetical protein
LQRVLTLSVLVLIILLFLTESVKAQTSNDSLFLFRGRLLTADSLLPLEDAYVISKHMLWGTISDSSGYFEMYTDSKDSLMITSLGYRDKLYIISDSIEKTDKLFKILMYKDTITLNEVLIRAFWDYEIFKQMVLDMRLPDDLHIDLEDEDRLLNRPLQPAPMGPVQALYNLFNADARLQRKLIKNRKRYNRMMIQMGRLQDTIPPIPEHMPVKKR